MARLSSMNPPAAPADSTSANLTRMLARLQKTIINPDAETEARLHHSSLERQKLTANLEYAKSLLVKLEQDAQSIRVQVKKQETQADLVDKRTKMQDLYDRLEELNQFGDLKEDEDDSSEGEDLLGEDTPSEETDSHAEPPSEPESPIDPSPPQIQPIHAQKPPPPPQVEESSEKTPEPPSNLRSRNVKHQEERAELLQPYSTGASTGMSTKTSEALLDHNNREHENLSNIMLEMAKDLKKNSRSFAAALEDEKGVLDSAVQGMDRNELGLEAATRRMGTLRNLTEGRGLFGRLLMYAYIAGLMVVAILLVFVMPKLRF